MSKKMLVNATHHEENRVAIVEDGILSELDIEVAGHEPTKGNIYKAVVVRVESGLQAAFVDYGAERLGFLQIDEINYKTVKPDYQPAEDGRRPKITDLLQRGQELLVQITKEERGTKGAALTTYLSLAGRYMVIMPGSQTRGVSRKAESDAQRKELKKAMSSLELTEGIGYIVRTAALDQTREELERDYRYLLRLYESITSLAEKAKAPSLIYKESNLMIRSIRDYFTTDMDEVLIDDPQVFKEAKDFFQMVMPDQVRLVKLHQERRPIFSRYQIEDQIEILNRNKIPLPSGGSIVIDPTEALVAIDVNSGKMASEQGVEATATKTNLEAATEIGRQLRLRDLGGLIVIDFIDMRERKHMRQVEEQVRKSLANDKARVNVGRISQFGLLELSRQRIKAALTEGSYLPCPHCEGTGRLKSPETQAIALLRKIHASAAKGQVSRVDAQLPLEVAEYLLNSKREELVEMERDHHLQIHIHGNRDFLADQFEIDITRREKEKTSQQEFVSAGSLPILEKEPVTTENGEDSDQKTPDQEEESGKKRRRRRRRKPASTAGEAKPTTQQVPDEGPAEHLEQQLAAEAPSEATVESTGEEAAEETPAKKPQRRRRSSARTKPAEAPTTEGAAANDSARGSEPEAQPEQPATEPASAEEKPKRKPRRKAGTKGESKSSKKQEVSDAASVSPRQPESEQVHAEPAPAEKPKSGRGRRPAKKPSTDEQAVTAGEEGKAVASAKADEKPAGQAPKKKPARRTRKKSTEPKPASAEAATAETKTDAPHVTQPDAAAEEKSRQRRAGQAKPKEATTEPKESKETTSKKSETEPKGKKPATRRPPRKPSTKAAAKSKQQPGSSPADTDQTPQAEAPGAKPGRRRTTKKKTAEESSAPASTENS